MSTRKTGQPDYETKNLMVDSSLLSAIPSLYSQLSSDFSYTLSCLGDNRAQREQRNGLTDTGYPKSETLGWAFFCHFLSCHFLFFRFLFYLLSTPRRFICDKWTLFFICVLYPNPGPLFFCANEIFPSLSLSVSLSLSLPPSLFLSFSCGVNWRTGVDLVDGLGFLLS
jgi:hypothetical protein